jgi:tetratricopeptide (TPR) repeat protein
MRAFSWIAGGLTVVAFTGAGDATVTRAPEPGPQIPPVVQVPPARHVHQAELELSDLIAEAMDMAMLAMDELDLAELAEEAMLAAELSMDELALAMGELDLAELAEEAMWAAEMSMDELDLAELAEKALLAAELSMNELALQWPQIPPPPRPPDIPDFDLRWHDLQFDISPPEFDFDWPDFEWQDIEWPEIDIDIEWDDFALEMAELNFEWPEIDIEVPELDFEWQDIHIPDIHIEVPEIHVDVPHVRHLGSRGMLELLEMTYEQQGDPGLAQFNEGKTLIFDEKYLEAREIFVELERQFPRSAYADDAGFWASYALEHIRGQTEAAFKSYEGFLAKYPESPFREHATASMVQLAERLYKQGMAEYREFIETAKTGEDDEIQLLALQALYRVEGEDIIPSLEALLADGSKSARVKREAVSILRRNENPRAVQVLQNTARQHADPDVRRRSISALGSRKDQASLQALTSIYQGERSVNARRYIADAAGEMRGTDFAAEAAAFLADVAQNDQDEDVRNQALGELARFEGEVSWTHLNNLLERTDDPASRRALLNSGRPGSRSPDRPR